MAETQGNTTYLKSASRIPAYILERDAIATAAGLQVSRRLDDGHLLSSWSGCEQEFRATGIFSDKFKFHNSRNLHRASIHHGGMSISQSGEITLTLSDSYPRSIKPHANSAIQIYEYDGKENATRYYGSADNLIEAGVITPAIARKVGLRYHVQGSDQDAKRYWNVFKQANGKLLVELTEYAGRDRVQPDRGQPCSSAEEFTAELSHLVAMGYQAAIDWSAGNYGWKLTQDDIENLTIHKAQALAIIKNASARRTSVPTLTLVKVSNGGMA